LLFDLFLLILEDRRRTLLKRTILGRRSRREWGVNQEGEGRGEGQKVGVVGLRTPGEVVGVGGKQGENWDDWVLIKEQGS
jgi:hypothetical protein